MQANHRGERKIGARQIKDIEKPPKNKSNQGRKFHWTHLVEHGRRTWVFRLGQVNDIFDGIV